MAFFENRFWDDGTSNYPPPKSQGSTVMTSDFFSEKDGLVAYSDAAWEIKKREPEIAAEIRKEPRREITLRRAGAVLNVSTDGYYERQRFLADVTTACDIFDANHGGEFQMMMMLDNSPIHNVMAEDELNARRMNVRPGGKQPLMRDGYFYRDGIKVIFFYDSRTSSLAITKLIQSMSLNVA